MNWDKRALRKHVIKEMYGTSMRFLLEAEGDPPVVDPAAAPADPAAAPADPVPPPVADPAAATAPDPLAGLGGAVPGVPPTPGAPAASPVQGTKASISDDPIEKFLVKADELAIKKASNKTQVESFKRRRLSFLMEAEGDDPDLDMDSFAGDIARLIKNYTSLVDVKGNVVTKAQKYLKDKYPKKGQIYSDELVSLLGKDYDIRLEPKEEPPDSYATGAKSSGGAAS